MAGPMLDGVPPPYPASIAVKGPTDARDAVRRLKQQGVDFIKVQSGIPRDAYFAAVDEAKKQGLTLVGHVPNAVRAVEASDAGQKTVEHFTGVFEGCSDKENQLLTGPKGPHILVKTYSEPRAEALVREFSENQTWQVPTLVTERVQWLIEDSASAPHPLEKYVPAYWKDRTWKRITELIRRQIADEPLEDRRRFVQMELDMASRMRSAGVPFMAGTDTAPGPYVIPGFSLHDELELFVAAGFTPLEALQTATLNPARFLGLTNDLGTVADGKIADLLVVTADPLKNINNTRQVAGVIVNGRWFSRADLDEMLNRVSERALHSSRLAAP
jgi:imidazolonepropionase-like amidohydrolase